MRAAAIQMSRTRLIFVLSVVAVEASWFSLLAYLGVRLLD
jgi:arginine exporter protein ArgO